MASRSSFELLKPASATGSLQRLGAMKSPNRPDILTPNHLVLCSRGFVPHLTTDILQTTTSIQAVHAGYEDCSVDSPLKQFIALPKTSLLVLGPRRGKPVGSAIPNQYTSLNICTSYGHRELEITVYLEAIEKSRPDVIIAPVDIEFGRQAPGAKRRDKMVERSTAWLRSFMTALSLARGKGSYLPAAWVPILPLEAEVQQTYLQHLEEAEPSLVNGILVYDSASTICIPRAFQDKAVISLTDPATPHDILKLIALGVDLVAAPFVTAAAEAGVALDFEFPAAKREDPRKALGSNMWSEANATDLAPLVPNCSCYTCTSHHKAYIRHLLSAKEMLAWTLLQIHNHHVMNKFFAGVRGSILDGTFTTAAEDFYSVYESEFHAFEGQGPRIRGYQASLGQSPKKLNQAPFKELRRMDAAKSKRILNDRKEKWLESQSEEVLSPSMDAEDLQDLGVAELYEESSDKNYDLSWTIATSGNV